MMVTATDSLFEPTVPRQDAVERRPEPPAKVTQEPQLIEFPCSVTQERFWLLDRLEPGNPSYNVAVRWRLEGRIATPLLEQAWREIIARHEVLRTHFLERAGKPVQQVAPQGTLRIIEVDLSGLSEAQADAESDRIGVIEARAPFDLGSGPLLRVVLVRHCATTSILFVTTHQIVSDGWSIGVMARELGVIYEALSRQTAVPLEPLAIQYGDYSRWQLAWLAERDTAAEMAYWSRQLSGVVPFEVSADRPRPAVPTTNGAIASLVLPRSLTDRMQALGAEQGVTLFSTAVAALCTVLARYTGKTEIVLGTQVSGRDQLELEPMIGQFVNSLILRNDVSGAPRFKELVQRVGATIADALEHRHIPIETLLGMVKSGRGGSSRPPVSVNFIFQRTFIENRQYSDFALIDLPSLPAGAIYDLNFFMVERPDGWRFSCQYNTDQFEADTANRLLRYFQTALENAVRDPECRVTELTLADPAETERIAQRLREAQSRTAPVTQPQIEPAGGAIDPATERALTAIWSQLLGPDPIDPNANFFELGGHSLLAARMLAKVEEKFARRITLSALFRTPSIRGLSQLLRSETREFDFRQVVKLHADGANLPLIAINNTGVYYLLARHLGAAQPVTSLQVFDPAAKPDALPGTLQEIAAEYVKLIFRVQPKGPFVLAGWCVAGALAFEIACQLEDAGHTVRNLFLVDSWVPRYFERLPRVRRLLGSYSLRWQLARADWLRFTSGQQSFGTFFKQRILVLKMGALLSGKPALPAPLEGAQIRGSEAYDRWLLEYLQRATDLYEPRRYPGRITLFRSTEEPTGWLFDPLAGWGAFAARGVQLEMIRGNHYTMFQNPGAEQMAQRMAALMATPP